MKSQCCPICDGPVRINPKARDFLALDKAPKSYTIMSCISGCKLSWMTPYPQPDDYQELYSNSYYEDSQAECSPYSQEKDELADHYNSIARNFLALNISGTLLDIGCGTGSFLVAAQSNGINAEGIEPSEYAANKASEQGLKVTCGTLGAHSKKLYQAAFCSHVLEHVPDAHDFMQNLSATLSPGAPVYIEVPLQFDGVLDLLKRTIKKKTQYSIYSIHHHYFFTPSAITLLLQRHGFEVLSLKTFLPSRRSRRKGFRTHAIQFLLWTADRFLKRGDVISVWARRV
ncbi:class I SAM-dependent methyltransferase [Pseudomonas sp. AOB-7]|nr:class I SAM-dependent methyltransferase [Pseudomonas sp. AOB-7]